jgi:hypothetical protein
MYRRVASKSHSNEPKNNRVIAASAVAKGGRDGAGSSHPQQGNYQIAYAGQHLSPLATTCPTAIFIKGDIPNPMQTIFNGPVASAQTQEAFGMGPRLRQAGDAIHDFGTTFLAD